MQFVCVVVCTGHYIWMSLIFVKFIAIICAVTKLHIIPVSIQCRYSSLCQQNVRKIATADVALLQQRIVNIKYRLDVYDDM